MCKEKASKLINYVCMERECMHMDMDGRVGERRGRMHAHAYNTWRTWHMGVIVCG